MPESQRPFADASDHELERALTALGPQLSYPATPDLAGSVLAKLSTDTMLSFPIRKWRWVGDEGWWPSRTAWLAAACLLIAIVAGLTLFPEARTAIADRLGLRGVTFRWVDEAPTPAPPPVGASLMLGRPVTLEEAQAAVDFPILMPTSPGADEPSEIYLSGKEDGAMISFVYPAGPEFPASGATGVGALLTQFEGETDRGLIEKGLLAPGGNDEPQTRLDAVVVNGQRGFWISGAPHAVFFVCFDAGECREERSRLVGDVLLWEQDGLTLRLESALSRDEAIAVASSVQAAE